MQIQVHSGVTSLHKLRLQRAWSQKQLHARSGVDQSQISQIETGARTRIALRTMRRLSDALGVEPMQVDEFRRAIEAMERASDSAE